MKSKVNVFIQDINTNTLLPSGEENPLAGILVVVMGQVATIERKNIANRLHSGREIAKANGVHFGRRQGQIIKTHEDKEREYSKVLRDLRQGLSVAKVAKIHSVSESTVKRLKFVGRRLSGKNSQTLIPATISCQLPGPYAPCPNQNYCNPPASPAVLRMMDPSRNCHYACIAHGPRKKSIHRLPNPGSKYKNCIDRYILSGLSVCRFRLLQEVPDMFYRKWLHSDRQPARAPRY